MVFGGTRGLAAELPEVTNVVERHRGLSEPFVFGIHRAGAGEVKHRPQQHRGMTVGVATAWEVDKAGGWAVPLRFHSFQLSPKKAKARKPCLPSLGAIKA